MTPQQIAHEKLLTDCVKLYDKEWPQKSMRAILALIASRLSEVTPEMVEAVAKAIYDCDPLRDQSTDDDGRPTSAAFDIPWSHLAECDETYQAWCFATARYAIPALLAASCLTPPK